MARCANDNGSNEVNRVLPSSETESDSEQTACMTVAGTALYHWDITEFEQVAQRKVDQCWTGHDKGNVF